MAVTEILVAEHDVILEHLRMRKVGSCCGVCVLGDWEGEAGPSGAVL